MKHLTGPAKFKAARGAQHDPSPIVLSGKVESSRPIIHDMLIRGPGGEAKGDFILDSGAMVTVISEEMQEKIQGPIVARRPAKGLCGTCEVILVGARIELPNSVFGAPGNFVVKSDLAPYAGLLGQDFLAAGTLVIDGPRRSWTFTILPAR